MTQKLYYEDQYIREFSAEIIDIFEKDKEFHIQLDKTAFFPGSCGQPCDIGSIEDSIITTVYEKEGIIYHVSNKKPIKIHRVKCKIDWDSRFDTMQQHLGMHILSSAILELYGANTVSYHFEKAFCTIDIDKILNNEELEQIEELANKNIFESKSVEAFIPTKSELKKLLLKKTKASDYEGSRVVKIEDINVFASGALLPKSTIEAQFIRIMEKSKMKGNTNTMRLEFICGKRAILDSLNNYKFSSKICQDLKSTKEEVLLKIETISSEFNNLLSENKNLKLQVADFEVQDILNNCEKIGEVRIIKNVFTSSDLKHINLLSTKLTSFSNVIVLHALKLNGMATLIFMCSKDLKNISMNDLLKDAISLIDGKGGGSAFSAQGGGKSVNNLNPAMDYAYAKLKSILISK